MPYSDEVCVFCGIVDGSAAAIVVEEDSDALAFLDVAPAAPGHTLVIPKRHASDLMTAPDADVIAVARMTRSVAQLLDERLRPDGLTVFQANRTAGWQDVFHLHVHVVPRMLGDQLVKPWSNTPLASSEELADMAKRLGAAQ